jgi:ribosomal protein L17
MDVITQIKFVILAAIIVGISWYLYDLNHTIDTQKVEIVQLKSDIVIQNNAITTSGNKAKELQTKLDDIIAAQNTKTDKKAKDLKKVIIDRPVDKTCDDKVNNLSITAKTIAQDWNSK